MYPLKPKHKKIFQLS